MIKNYFKNESIQLVSRSPRRKEILSGIYENVTVVDFNFDEQTPKDMKVVDVPVFLANHKMDSFLQSTNHKMDKIITADTIVCYPEKEIILGKPKSKDEAKEMLLFHFGKEHLVITSVCYFDSRTNTKEIITDEARVRFKPSDKIPGKELIKYLNLLPPHGPMDKAGAYGIQEKEVYAHMIEAVIGDINTVIGFPLKQFMSVVVNRSSGNRDTKSI